MAESCTVVIASENRLDALKARASSADRVLAFSDADPLNALDAITRHKPQVVALERLFAATSRGAALINRIKADPALTFAEIWVVSHDGTYSRVSERRLPPQAPPADAAASPAPDLDRSGTRRAPRIRMADGTQIQIDGATAGLVDLSAIGAQVVSTGALKPQQRVRLALADDLGVVRFDAEVAWAAFEIPKGTTRYRAGLAFGAAKTEAIEAFATRHKNA